MGNFAECVKIKKTFKRLIHVVLDLLQGFAIT